MRSQKVQAKKDNFVGFVLFKKMDKVKLENDDSIRVYRICGDCVKHIRIWGVGEVTKDQDFYIA